MMRKNLIDLLLDNPTSIHDLCGHVGGKVKDIADDLEHLFKSLKHTEYKPDITPAECRKCGFVFGPEKILRPGKCPICRETWISDPLIGIRERKRK